jgi:hypothetical protein
MSPDNTGGRSPYEDRIKRLMDAGFTRDQARGHAGDQPSVSDAHGEFDWSISFFAEGDEPVVTIELDFYQAQRAGRYMALVRGLVDGRVTPDQFQLRTARMAPIAGHRLLADAGTVLALALTIDPDDLVFESGQAGAA